jgi:hypothetical protein
MRTDSISKCFVKDLQKRCPHCVYQTGSLLRKDVFSKYRFDKYCPLFEETGNYSKQFFCYKQNFRKVKSNCEEKCPKDCFNQFYEFQLKEKEQLSSISKWDKNILLHIIHNRLPDQVIKHIPEMELITVIGNFGGLLGMWLGLSAFAIIRFALKYL